MSHKLGQVFLKDKNIVSKILEYSAIVPEDDIVEIGCGDGDLSLDLSEMGKTLTIYEIDKLCVENTMQYLGERPNVTYILGDVLEQKMSLKKAKIIANIPYYISAKIVKWVIAQRECVESATLMFQKEFAQKLFASPGEKIYTSLSVYVSYYLDVEWGFNVSRNSFSPRPKVDSAVIKLIPKQAPFEVNEDQFFNMVRSSFWGRRKKLLTALKNSPYIQLAPEFSQDPHIGPFQNIRGEILSLEKFHQLYQIIEKYFID